MRSKNAQDARKGPVAWHHKQREDEQHQSYALPQNSQQKIKFPF